MKIQNAKKMEDDCIHNLDLNNIINSQGNAEVCLNNINIISNYSRIVSVYNGERRDQCLYDDGQYYDNVLYKNHLIKSDLALYNEYVSKENDDSDIREFYRCVYCYKILYCKCYRCWGCTADTGCKCLGCTNPARDDI